MVARRTGAFVPRSWRTASRLHADDVWRIEIVRIHDGERTVFTTLDEAWGWLRIQLTGSEPPRPDDCSAPKEMELNDGPANSKGEIHGNQRF
jgi:hypothetical protein